MPIITIKNDTYIRKIFYWTFRASHGLATVDCFYFLFGTGKKFLIEFFFTSVSYRICSLSFHLFFPFADVALLATGTGQSHPNGPTNDRGLLLPCKWNHSFLGAHIYSHSLSFFNSPFPVCPFLFLFLLFQQVEYLPYCCVALGVDSRALHWRLTDILSQRIIHLVEHTCLP